MIDVADQESGQTHDYWVAYRKLARTNRPLLTPLLLLANVVVFLAMVASGMDPVSFKASDLVDWGGNWGPDFQDGEVWRLLTAMFLHGSIIHLGLNMIALWEVGRLLEMFQGHLRFFIIYFLSGLFASMASLWHDPYVVSVGASGALFGVYGAYVGYLIHERNSMPRQLQQRLLQGSILFITINVAYGFQVEGIDNAAHIGGLVMGAILGWYFSHSIYQNSPIRPRQWFTAGTLVLALAVSIPATQASVGSRADFEFRLEWREASMSLQGAFDWHAEFLRAAEEDRNVPLVIGLLPEAFVEQEAALIDQYEQEVIDRTENRVVPVISSLQPYSEDSEVLVQELNRLASVWLDYTSTLVQYFSGTVEGEQFIAAREHYELQLKRYQRAAEQLE